MSLPEAPPATSFSTAPATYSSLSDDVYARSQLFSLQEFYSQQGLQGDKCPLAEPLNLLRTLFKERTVDLADKETRWLFEHMDKVRLAKKQLMQIINEEIPDTSVHDLRCIVEQIELELLLEMLIPRIKGSRVVVVLKKVLSQGSEPPLMLAGLPFPESMGHDPLNLTPVKKQYILALECLAKELLDRETLAWIRNGFEEPTFDYKVEQSNQPHKLNKKLFIGDGWVDPGCDQIVTDQTKGSRDAGEIIEKLEKLALEGVAENTVPEEEGEFFEFYYLTCQVHNNKALVEHQFRLGKARIEERAHRGKRRR